MTDATVNALIIAVPPTLIALSSFVSSLRNGMKADVISDKVNGAHTTSVNKIEELQNKITDLLATIAQSKQVAAVAAVTPTRVEVVNNPTSPVPIKPVNPDAN